MENSHPKTTEPAAGAGAPSETAWKLDPARHISPKVAHELNNIITIIQGYADRLLFKHGEDPALKPHLKLISEAAQRAATVVRDALPPNPSLTLRQNPPPPPHNGVNGVRPSSGAAG